MIYLETFQFPDAEQEFDFFMSVRRTCYDSFYPFKILSKNQFHRIDFEPVTILYGGNGSGKTTALNIIAEKLDLRRDSEYNRASFFGEYVSMCRAQMCYETPVESRIITSDDVFDYMLNIRAVNSGIDKKREELFEDYIENKYSGFRMSSLEDFDKLKKVNASRSKSQSKYVRNNLNENIRSHSNGESAFHYFTEKICDNNLYLLDEPENSLSPERQIELVTFIENAARYFECQFVIATHSPFLMSIAGAKIYDMDEYPVDIKRWTELHNVKVYHDFFQKHKDEFR